MTAGVVKRPATSLAHLQDPLEHADVAPAKREELAAVERGPDTDKGDENLRRGMYRIVIARLEVQALSTCAR